jgi:hypothetical protein
MLPVTLPLAAGANVTLRAADCPGVRIIPVAIPAALKPAPEMLTLEMVTLAVPALVKDTV